MTTTPQVLWKVGLWWTLFILLVIGLMAAGFDTADLESSKIAFVIGGGLTLMGASLAIQVLTGAWGKLEAEYK